MINIRDTYKELKPCFNELATIYSSDIRDTYKELKHGKKGVSYSVKVILEIPIRN